MLMFELILIHRWVNWDSERLRGQAELLIFNSALLSVLREVHPANQAGWVRLVWHLWLTEWSNTFLTVELYPLRPGGVRLEQLQSLAASQGSGYSIFTLFKKISIHFPLKLGLFCLSCIQIRWMNSLPKARLSFAAVPPGDLVERGANATENPLLIKAVWKCSLTW